MPQLPHRAVDDLHQHIGGLFALAFGYRCLQETGDRGKAALPVPRRPLDVGRAGEQVERAARTLGQLRTQRRAIVAGHRQQREAARRLPAHRRTLQRGAQAHPVVDGALRIGRNAQVAERLVRLRAHAGEEDRLPVERDRQHVVAELARLAVGIAQLVLHRRPDVAQFALARHPRGVAEFGTQAGIAAALADAARILLARCVGDSLDVHQAEVGELDGVIGAGTGQPGVLADRAGQGERLRVRPAHREAGQLEPGAAVLEARLVNRDAVVDEGLVDLDPGVGLLAGAAVGHDDVAGEQLRHAGRVMLDGELLERDGERQILDQRPVPDIQDRRAHGRPLGHERIAPKTRVGHRQPVLRADLADDRIALDRRLAAEPHLQADHHVAIQQPADADDDNGRMRQDVADLVARARLGCDERGAAVAREGPDAEASVLRERGQARRDHGGLRRRVELILVVERTQAALAHVLAPDPHVGQHLGCIAHDAQRGRHDQERQDQQEPPRAVHRRQRQRAEHVGPERPELVDVVRVRLVLLEHRADHAGNGDHRQQADRKAHRRQQLDRLAQGAPPRVDPDTGGGNRRHAMPVQKRKQGGDACASPPCSSC